MAESEGGRTCKDCRWANPITIRGNVVERVECRRFPPSRFDVSGYAKFLVVEPAAWCGEFQSRQ